MKRESFIDLSQDQNETLSQGQQSSSKLTAHEVQVNGVIKKRNKKKKNINTELIANLVETKYTVVKKVMKQTFGFKIVRDFSNDDWDLYWTDNAVTPQQLSKMKHHQKINHFPGMFSLSRKNYLARNLTKMQKKFPQQYNFFPKTWVLPSQLNELRRFFEIETNPVIIAKPQASSQGKGIFLSKSIEDFDFGEHYVVQKYLKKPFLIEGLKFDLRVYVLVVGCDPLRVYIYKEGLARFATDLYVAPKKDNLKNLYMHLTNYAINKNSDKFQFNNSKNQMDIGHKRSLSSVLIKIEQMGYNRQKIWDGIKDCIAKTLISAQPLLSHHYRACQSENYANNMCFEILGFDVILDCNLHPQILEVNYTPSFSTDTPLDLQIKKNLIADSLNLMNFTAKAKNQVIQQKKKQMMQRTLTGKKFYHTKQSRQELIDKIQKQRDIFQMKNIGNFQKILPLGSENQGDIEKNRKYQEFLIFSEDYYLQTTGANIRRNDKVVKQTNKPNLLSQISQAQLNEYPQENNSKLNQQIYNQPQQKFTNTQNLEKIYKTKFRPMVYKKSTTRTKNGMGPILAKKQSQVSNSSSKFLTNKMGTIENKQMIQNPSENLNTISKFPSPYNAPNPRAQKVSRRGESQSGGRQSNKNKVRNASSVKRGLSNIYNITFQEKNNTIVSQSNNVKNSLYNGFGRRQ